LAEIVGLDRAHHRPVAGDSELGEAIKLVATGVGAENLIRAHGAGFGPSSRVLG